MITILVADKRIVRSNYYRIVKKVLVEKENAKHFTRLMLPTFKAGTMYTGMELNKEYTLEELGL